MEMLRAEALPGSKGLTRLHLEMRLPCPVWGAMNVTGPVKAWSLAAEPPEVRVTLSHRAALMLQGTAPFPSSLPCAPVHPSHCLEELASLSDTGRMYKYLYEFPAQDLRLQGEERAEPSGRKALLPL